MTPTSSEGNWEAVSCPGIWGLRGRDGVKVEREEATGGRREKPAGSLARGERWKVAMRQMPGGWEAPDGKVESLREMDSIRGSDPLSQIWDLAAHIGRSPDSQTNVSVPCSASTPSAVWACCRSRFYQSWSQ